MVRNFLYSTALASLSLILIASNASALEPPSALKAPELKITGNTSFNSWFFHNEKKLLQGNRENSVCRLEKFGRGQFFTIGDARLRFLVNGKLDTGMEYGLAFVFDAATSAGRAARENYLYFGGSWGKLTLGDTFGVASTMTFGGYDQWGGASFVDGTVFRRVVNATTGVVTSVDLVGDTSRDTKLTYVTPRWNGFQLGISYTPRSEHRGEERINSITSTSNPKEPFDTDNIANAINFIHKFSNGFEMALSASSVFAAETHPEFKGAHPRRDTFSYAFGGTFTYEDIGFSLEYGNNTDSRTFTGRDNTAGKFFDLGVSYTWGATKFSGGYYTSSRTPLFKEPNKKHKSKECHSEKATMHAVSAAIDQKLAPGLGIYFEFNHFNMKNRVAREEAQIINKNNKCDFVGPVPSNKANVFVIGSRLVF